MNEARRIGEAEVRCYLNLTKLEIAIHMDRIPVLVLSLKNFGQSPAVCVTGQVVLRWVDFEEQDLRAGAVTKHQGKPHTIPSGKKYEIYYDVDSALTEEDAKEFVGSATLRLVAIVTLKWKDVFGSDFSEDYTFFGCARNNKARNGFSHTFTFIPVADFSAVLRAEATRRANERESGT